MSAAIITALAWALALGLFTLGMRHALKKLGGRDPDPLPEIPIPTREELREARRARHTALHDEWDAEFRRLTPPTKGGPVWERRPYRKDTP